MSSYLNTEPDLGDHESILQAYPAEVYLTEREDPAAGDPTYEFLAPARDPVTFDDERRALRFADLYTVLDGFRTSDVGDRGIPVNVATAGPAAIATYMYAAWEWTPTQISRTIDVERQVVLDYLARIDAQAERL